MTRFFRTKNLSNSCVSLFLPKKFNMGLFHLAKIIYNGDNNQMYYFLSISYLFLSISAFFGVVVFDGVWFHAIKNLQI